MDPDLPIENLPGVGASLKHKLNKLEIATIEDLIYHFPFRYDDFSQIELIQNVAHGEKLSVQGVVWQIKNIRTRTGKYLTRATVADQSGTIDVIWFNQPYLTKTLKSGLAVSLSGQVDLSGPRPVLMSPSYEVIRGGNSQSTIDNRQTLHTGRLVPIYPETEGLSSKWFRTKIADILPQYLKVQNDFLPKDIISRHRFLPLNNALNKIHFPKTYEEVEAARKRLAFDELFLMQLLSQKRKLDWHQKRKAPKMQIDKEAVKKLIKTLPFTLTFAQVRALKEILVDLTRQTPANRLLEGDVGSGKTVVAAIAAYVVYLNGFDTLIAAPTEILAFQHQKTLSSILAPFGVTVGIWTGSKKQEGHIICGTHALLTTFKSKRQIGLVVVDEQHRFGVAQRAKLFLAYAKKLTPHLLTMTATPIPRTLALTLYGDLDLSVLDQMPIGRQKIATFVVPNLKRNGAYSFIEKQIREGRQAFIITPFVEPSETMATVKAAVEEFEKLKKVFSSNVILSTFDTLSVNSAKNLKLGLLHGRLKSKDKEKIINNFKSNKIHVLVTTPVVEVGIDVPNATVMMIESADRFGLAQLHQLRGRVGRGEHKSYCLLFTDSRAENTTKRLKSMEKIYVGFELAEIDLKMRGPGEVFGLRQSGYTNLKLADLSDATAISLAQQEAKNIITKDPSLRSHPLLARRIESLQIDLAQPN